MAEGHEFPRVIRGHLPPEIFFKGICAEPEMSYNFEKCYGECTGLVTSGFFSDIVTYRL